MQPDVGTGAGHGRAGATGRLTRSAGLAGVATLTSRVLGLAREIVLATVFGAGNDMDAFSVAFRIPNLTRDLFAEGAMSAAFVPAFATQLGQGKPHAWRLANNVLNVLLVTTGSLVVLGIVFARPLVTAFAGAFTDVPGKLETTVWLTQIMLPFLSLVAIAVVMMGMLNSLSYYFVPSLAPAAFNVASIVCAIALVPVFTRVGQPGILALAVAVLLGGLGQILVQWPLLRREGFRYRLGLDLRDPALRRVLLLMGPGTLGLAATQINLLVTTMLATGQGPGAVSWLTYAFRLMYLPIGLFGVSIATAVLPTVARQAAAGDRQSIRETVSHGLSLMLVVNVPAMFGLWILATPIVRLLLEHGRFDASDTAATAAALRFYALGLVGYSAVRIVSPVFYALGRNRVPVIVSVASIVLNMVLSVSLANVLGFRGLALSTSLAAVANAAVLLWLLRQHLDRIDGRRLAGTFARIMVAGAVMAAVAVGVERAIAGILGDGGVVTHAVTLGAAILAGLVALGLVAKALRLSEFEEALAAITRRI